MTEHDKLAGDSNLCSMFTYGSIVFSLFAAISLFFYVSSLLMQARLITSEYTLIGLFVCIFTSTHCMLIIVIEPKKAEGKKAAVNIFTMMDTPSEINSIEQDNDLTLRRIPNRDYFRGDI